MSSFLKEDKNKTYTHRVGVTNTTEDKPSTRNFHNLDIILLMYFLCSVSVRIFTERKIFTTLPKKS